MILRQQLMQIKQHHERAIHRPTKLKGASGLRPVWLWQAMLALLMSVLVYCGACCSASPETAGAQDNKAAGTGRRSDAGAPSEILRSFSLKSAFDLANQRNREIEAARYNLPVSFSGIKIAGAIPNPRFALQYGWGPAYTIIIAGNPQQFGFQQQLQTAGKRAKQVLVAEANYHSAEFSVAALIFDVHNRVRRAYAALAAAEAYASLIESERKVADELFQIAEKRFNAGKGSKSDSLQAELGVMQFDTQRNQSQARLQQASANLSLLIGEIPRQMEIIDVDDNGIFKLSAEKSDLVPPPTKELPPLAQLLPVGYLDRPDLKLAIQESYADRKSLNLAKAQRIPDLYLESGYQFTTFLKSQPFGLANGRVPNQPGCYLNAGFETPVFYQHQGEVAQAKATLAQDQDQITQIKWQIASDIVTAYESVAVSRANIIKFQAQLIPASAQVARLARRRYEVGKADLASAILAKQQYQQILASYFDSVVAYQNAWADLEKAVGVPLQL